MSSTVKPILDAVKAALAAAAPTRVVTRKLEGFAERNSVDLEKGVFTLLNTGRRDEDAHISYLKGMLVGQLLLGEDADGEAVEEAELVMMDDVARLVSGVQGCRIIPVGEWKQSRQIELPYGWISVDLEIGPFDLSIGVDEAGLSDFTTLATDYDIAPHVSAAEHIKWIGGDYSTTAPELKDELNP